MNELSAIVHCCSYHFKSLVIFPNRLIFSALICIIYYVIYA